MPSSMCETDATTHEARDSMLCLIKPVSGAWCRAFGGEGGQGGRPRGARQDHRPPCCPASTGLAAGDVVLGAERDGMEIRLEHAELRQDVGKEDAKSRLDVDPAGSGDAAGEGVRVDQPGVLVERAG